MKDSRSVVVLCTAILASLAVGCATRMSVEEASGESAKLEFRVIDRHVPAPMLYWRESPWHVETALNLEPPAQDCAELQIYANREPDQPVKLGAQAVSVVPLQLNSRDEELSSWERITEQRCALLVTVGRIAGDDFTGVSISVPGEVIRRHGIGIQEDLAGKHRWWGMVPFAVIFDVTHIPLYYALGLIGSSVADPVEPVTVVFKFPDGQRKVATLYGDEVKRMLRDIYPEVLSELPFALKRVRTWVRAALINLGIEFTEEAGGELVHDEWIPDSLSLTMLDGKTGNWIYRLDTASEGSDDLGSGMGDTSSITFELARPDDPDV